MDLVHPIPTATYMLGVVGFVLLFGRQRWYARGAARDGDDPVARRRRRQRIAVFRSAGISLLIVALISYLAAGG